MAECCLQTPESMNLSTLTSPDNWDPCDFICGLSEDGVYHPDDEGNERDIETLSPDSLNCAGRVSFNSPGTNGQEISEFNHQDCEEHAEIKSQDREQHAEVNDQDCEERTVMSLETEEGVKTYDNEFRVDDEWLEVLSKLHRSVGMEAVPSCLDDVATKFAGQWPEYTEPQDLPQLIQDKLVELYFRHIHVMFPVLDEYEFCTWYYGAQKEQREPLRLLVFYALIFITFPHLEQDLLRNTPFLSWQEGRSAFFEYTQFLYHSLKHKYEGNIALAQAALLLSHWNPYDDSQMANSFWVNEAFQHVQMVKRIPAWAKTSVSHRQRVVWWCCVVRDRILSVGLRRPSQIKVPAHAAGDILTYEDFGAEIPFPMFSSVETKMTMVDAFVSLCKLTNIMAEVIAPASSTEVAVEQHYDTNFPELEKIITIERELQEWSQQNLEIHKRIDATPSCRYDRVQVRIMNLISLSLVIFLYEPYLRLSESSQGWPIKRIAIQKVKATSSVIAQHVGDLLRDSKMEDIPQLLLPWIILPIAVHLVEINIQGPFTQNETVSRFGNLMRVLHGTKMRFEGASFVARLVDRIISTIIAEFEQCSSQNSPIDQSLGNVTKPDEEQLLVLLSRIIGLGLSDGVL